MLLGGGMALVGGMRRVTHIAVGVVGRDCEVLGGSGC